MGKKDKNKKKGKGAEKTIAKTNKKLDSKLKKELETLGEDDIESIVSQIEKEEKQKSQVTEKIVDCPSRRINFTLTAHPDKDELILFGGEFFNGQKTFVYNDLFYYNIPNNTWTLVHAPAGPPPRCGHQTIATSANKGQLWVFGGEFTSTSQSQFYHYRDLWIFHLATKRWEKINAPNGPSARSGHRMVHHKKQLFVFGGFHETFKDYKYFNDLYCFNTETYTWSRIEPAGTSPSPRSGCCLLSLPDGRLLIYGGYSKEKIKKDVDKGQVHTDSFLVAPDKNDLTGLKWKWVLTKLGGLHLSPRCSMPMTTTLNNLAFAFGGVFDQEDEETLSGLFYNDLASLDIEKLVWNSVTISGKKENKSKRRKAKETALEEEEAEEEMEVDQTDEINEAVKNTTISDDGVFKVTIGPTQAGQKDATPSSSDVTLPFAPSPRMNCGLAVKRGILYLYGGMFEDGDKEITFNDFYSLDLRKLDNWKTIIANDQSQEWLGSDSESEGDASDNMEDESEDNSGSDEDEPPETN